MEIYFSYFDSPIGILEIVASKHAVQSIRFVDAKNVAPLNSPKILMDCIKQIEEYFAGERKDFTVNTEQSGTDFQRLVWKKLYEIPFGKTASYIEIARVLGDEKSTRAVGSANGKNKIPIIIPCHRVIGTNDSLVGYSGGLWRKQWLLEHEKNITYGIQKLF